MTNDLFVYVNTEVKCNIKMLFNLWKVTHNSRKKDYLINHDFFYQTLMSFLLHF